MSNAKELVANLNQLSQQLKDSKLAQLLNDLNAKLNEPEVKEAMDKFVKELAPALQAYEEHEKRALSDIIKNIK